MESSAATSRSSESRCPGSRRSPWTVPATDPASTRAADGEVRLDLEVIGAVAPGAELLVYFAPMTDRGFVDAVTTAVFDPRRPSIISISWGDAEANWTEQARFALDDAFHAAAALGITVCAASGDAGWKDGVTEAARTSTIPRRARTCSRAEGRDWSCGTESITEVVWNDHDGNRPEAASASSTKYRSGSGRRTSRDPSTRVGGADEESRTSRATPTPRPDT